MHKNTLPLESRVAFCKICTLATIMRDCKNCPFNVGLEKPVPVKVDAVSNNVQVKPLKV